MTKTFKSMFFAIGLLLSVNVLVQMPTAHELAQRITIGVNLGNTSYRVYAAIRNY